MLAQADLDRAVGLVAGTDNDTTNLSLVAAARRSNPSLFIVGPAEPRRPARRCSRRWSSTRCSCPAELVAHEVYAQLSTPLLWRFLREMPAQGRRVGGRRSSTGSPALCGTRLQALWKVRLTRQEAPTLAAGWPRDRPGSGDLLRNPENRDEPLHAVPLLVLRGGEATLAPDDDFVLAAGDELLLAGWPAARRALGHHPLRRRRPRVRGHRPAGAVELDLAEAQPDADDGARGGPRRPGAPDR